MNGKTNTDQHKDDVNKLNGFLRGEIAAVETYEQAMDAVNDAKTRSELDKMRASHALRVAKLKSHINGLGGVPEHSSGAWGAFAKTVEGGAKIFGEGLAVSTLEEGEDYGKKMYREGLDDLSSGTAAFVRAEIVPEQNRTHDHLSILQEQV